MDALQMQDAIMGASANLAEWQKEFMKRTVGPYLQQQARAIVARWTPEIREMLKQESPEAYAAIYKQKGM